MRELHFLCQTDVASVDVLVNFILDSVNFRFQRADVVQNGRILLKRVHFREEHTDAVFQQLKLFFREAENLIQILRISSRTGDSLENNNFCDSLTLVGYFIAAGGDGNKIFSGRGKEGAFAERIDHRTQRAVCLCLRILYADKKCAERLVYRFCSSCGTHKVLKMNNAFFHVLDLFHDHSVYVAVFLQHRCTPP